MHHSVRLIRKVLISFLSATLVLVVSGLVIHLQVPTIKASNMTVYRNQVSSNSPLKMSFNGLMNRESVQSHFAIFPEVRGTFNWTLNSLVFNPEERLKVGENYTLSVTKDATNILGKHLVDDYVVNFTVVDPPKVALAVPMKETPVDSKVTVMFDRPVVALTTLDELEKQSVPFTLEPKVKGRTKWIGTSSFQFIPETRLDYSTEYTATVPAGIKTVDDGVLENPYTFTFTTPRIALVGEVATTRASTEPIMLNFNNEVQLQSVLDHAKVRVDNADGEELKLAARYYVRKDTYYDDNGTPGTRDVEDKKTVELMPKSGSWGYDNTYSFSLTKGIAGLEGNLMSETEVMNSFTTGAYLSNHYPEYGALTVNPRGDHVLTFAEPVDLSSVQQNFSLEPSASIRFVYGKKCKEGWEPESDPNEKCPEVDDENVAVGILSNPLPNVARYAATLGKGVKAKNQESYLKRDVVWRFQTADVVRVLRTGSAVQPSAHDYYAQTYRANKNICIYSPTPFDEKDLDKQFVFTPALNRKLTFSTYVTSEKGYDNYSPCKADLNKGERYALLVNAFMNPLSTYKVTIKAGTRDTFGQTLAQDYNFSWKTDEIDSHDVSLSIAQTNRYAFVTPDQHAKPLFLSQNLESFDVDVCRMPAEKYLEIDTQLTREGHNHATDYDTLGWNAFKPSTETCGQYITKTITNPRTYWSRQVNELDLRQLLGLSADTTIEPGYYYVRAHSPKLFRYEYSYTNEGKYVPITKPYFVDQIITVTNMHVATKKSSQTALAWVNNLTTGKPLKDVSIKFFRSTGEFTDKSGSTNGQGVARIAINELPYQYVMAQYGNDSVIVNVDWNEGIGSWDYNISYSPLERLMQVYSYTDRPIYQPTHTVHFKGIVRSDYDAQLSLPTGVKTISVEVKDSRDTSIYKKDLPLSPQGTFNGELTLASDVPLGQYNLEACVYKKNEYCDRGWSFASFYVEEYVKPEYKLDVGFSSDRYVQGDELKATVSADYYFGAPVPNAQVNWSLNSQNYYFDEYKGDWYSFSDYTTLSQCYFGCPYNDSYLADGSGTTDDQGNFVITKLLDLRNKNAGNPTAAGAAADTSKLYTLNTTITDTNNRSVSKSTTFIVHRGEYYVGVKTDSYIVQAGKEVQAQAIAVDHKGNPLAGKSINLQLVKMNYKYVKKKNLDGGFYWENEISKKVVDDTNVTTDGDGKATASFTVPEGGEYVVVANSTDARGNTFSSSMDFYATTSEVVSWKQENNNRMELKLDQQQYKVGDVAHILVKSPYKDVSALVTYERGDIFDQKVVKIDSNAAVIDVPITEKMVPNFFVSVLEFKPGDAQNPPDFKLGYSDIRVNNEIKELKISIAPDKQNYAPGDTVKLNIATHDAAGKALPAEVSLAVVDESVLALKGNPKKDLLKRFYDHHFLGVTTADNLVYLLKRINVNDVKGAKGGSGKGIDDSLKPRGKFEDTATWKAQVMTDKDGRASVEFKLPDNLTTWNIEVVGISNDSHVGVATASVIARKPVMVRPVTPRFATYGDSLNIGGIIQNYTQSKQNIEVSMKVTGLVNTDRDTQTVTVDQNGSARVIWNVKVPYDQALEGNAHVVVTAKGQSSDAVEWDIALHPVTTPETVSTSSYTEDKSFTENVLVPSDAKPVAGSLTITTGATLATYVSSALNYLIQYPYGCSEQLTSSVVPMVTLKQAFKAVNEGDVFKPGTLRDEKGNIVSFDTAVNRAIQQIYAAQRSDGGWGYFIESYDSQLYLSAYVVSGLQTLKNAGYNIDANVLASGKSFLVNSLRSNRDLTFDDKGKPIKTSYWAMNRAYMLFVLSETGSGDLGLSYSLYDDRELLTPPAKAYLAMTLKKLNGQATKIDSLIGDLENAARIDARGTYIRAQDVSGYSMMTNVKSTAITLQAFARIRPNHVLIPKIIKWLIAQRVDGRWQTTQETSAVLTAFIDFMKLTGEAQSNYTAKVILNANDAGTYKVNPQNVLDQHTITKALSELKVGGSGNTVSFSKEGNGKLYYDLVFRYALAAENIKPRSEGFVIQRNYYAVTDTKMTKPLTSAKAGDTLHGHLTIVVPEDRTAVAVEAFVPAGFEITNFDLATADRTVLDLGNARENPEGMGYGEGDGNYYGKGKGGYPNYSENGYYMGGGFWTHKETRADRLVLFADHLPRGVYEYDFYVQATTSGDLNNPPSQVSELYFPENFARTEGGKFEVKE